MVDLQGFSKVVLIVYRLCNRTGPRLGMLKVGTKYRRNTGLQSKLLRHPMMFEQGFQNSSVSVPSDPAPCFIGKKKGYSIISPATARRLCRNRVWRGSTTVQQKRWMHRDEFKQRPTWTMYSRVLPVHCALKALSTTPAASRPHFVGLLMLVVHPPSNQLLSRRGRRFHAVPGRPDAPSAAGSAPPACPPAVPRRRRPPSAARDLRSWPDEPIRRGGAGGAAGVPEPDLEPKHSMGLSYVPIRPGVVPQESV